MLLVLTDSEFGSRIRIQEYVQIGYGTDPSERHRETPRTGVLPDLSTSSVSVTTRLRCTRGLVPLAALSKVTSLPPNPKLAPQGRRSHLGGVFSCILT